LHHHLIVPRNCIKI